MRVPHLLAVATIRGRRLFHSRAWDCVATIRGWLLFEGGHYSRAASIQRNMVVSNIFMVAVIISDAHNRFHGSST